MANETLNTASGSNNYYIETAILSTTGFFGFGWDETASSIMKGAIRFTNIVIPQGSSMSLARLYIYLEERYGTNQVKGILRGIDEDNTADFSSYPLGRSQTTASVAMNVSETGTGVFVYYDVSGIINEIVGRGGWSSGNALGFIADDNGTTTGSNTYLVDDATGTNSFFAYRVSAEPDFTPDPKVVVAGAIPDFSKYGIRVAKPNQSVLTAPLIDLPFDSNKKTLKIIKQGEINTSSGVLYRIPHSFGFTPLVTAWAEANGYRFKLNRFLAGAVDPVGSSMEGNIGATSTTIDIVTTPAARVYYYAFIDELA